MSEYSQRHWTREQLLVAFTLYTQIPFGRLHSRNPEIIHYAKLIGRTPSALAMKLVNIASLDPVITDSGRSGLKAASKADKQLWQEMNNDWDRFWDDSKIAMDSVENLDLNDPDEIKDTQISYFVDDKTSMARTRNGQNSFRKAVLCAYNGQCCITGINNSKLLIASHIVPWSNNKRNRLNPRNGLSLSNLHDKAFDSGLLTINENFEVKLSSELKEGKTLFHKNAFLNYENKQIILPDKFTPSQDFLEYHRSNIFIP